MHNIILEICGHTIRRMVRWLGSERLSQERVLKTLMDLGLTQSDAKVYIFLGKRGLQKGIDIARALKIRKQQIYRSLKNLENKGLVSATLDYPARYSAENFRKVIDLFIRAKMEEAQSLRQSKVSILQDWQSIAISENEDTSEKFTVIKGRNIIYSKIQQMIHQTKKHLSATTSVPNLARADQFGLIDGTFDQPIRDGIQLRFIIDLSEKNVQTVKNLLRKTPKQLSYLKIRVPDLGVRIFNRMIIRDEEEAMFFINTDADSATADQDDLCLWTNCRSLVYAFTGVFEDLWRNSTDIKSKIVQIETGKPMTETSLIQETEATHKKHVETILSAEKEIIMMTSAESLFRFWKNKTFTKKWAERGVSAKIMAPITTENFEAAKQLSQFIEVRHVPQSYLETTIVDGKHLFQFRKTSSDDKVPMDATHFRDSFYTNDFEQVGRMANSINDIWKNAQPPSTFTLESIKPYGFMPPPLSNNHWKVMQGVTIVEEKPGTITEEDVLNKMINANQPLDGEDRLYATAALALIHPPENFNLPDMLLRINHIGKLSGFGAEDNISVHLWLETPEGHAYVRAANIGDNPVAVTRRRECDFGDSPAKQYCRLVKKDKLQIRVFGNSLFCGWAIPIPLYPKYVLPPACLLVEGYGKVKTRAVSCVLSSGFRCAIEQNYFDAFVTFMHPTSKYSGPGTDGAFIRDLIITTTPPKK